MNDKWLDFAMRIQSIAQAGLQYGKDKLTKSDTRNFAEYRQKCYQLKQMFPLKK